MFRWLFFISGFHYITLFGGDGIHRPNVGCSIWSQILRDDRSALR
jgi:hypothetical protein